MASKLTILSQQREKLGHGVMTKDSLKWLGQKITELRNPALIPSAIKKEDVRNVKSVQTGAMYFFYYDPKLKEELPYYDKFPLTLILEKYNDGFLAVNLHYLPFKWRVAFMSKLIPYGAARNNQEEVARLHVTYDILEATRTLKEFRPCLKRYLYDHMQSRILAVQPNEWDTALALPIQQFKKATAKEVWADSLNEIRNS
jgi:hypothetical protein